MFRKLAIAGPLIVLLAVLPLAAQTTDAVTDAPVLQRRCTTVALASDTPLLPYRLIALYIERRPDFQASKLVLTADPDSADAFVQLAMSTGLNTKILVTNRITGRRSWTTSDWTNYPGMVALDAIDQLNVVCPGSVVEAPARAETSQCSTAPLAYSPIRSLTACSLTSWMDNRELYAALRSNSELKQMRVELRPSCSLADGVIEVTHNLEVTVEWIWLLKSKQGEVLSSGHAVAYKGGDAGTKIVDEIVRGIELSNGVMPQATQTAARSQSPLPTARKLTVKLLPSDFSVQDTRLNLFIDSEQVSARDLRGNVVFQFATRDLHDLQLKTEWDQPAQLDFPAGLVAWTANAGDHWFEPVMVGEEEMPFNHGAEFVAGAFSVMGYLGVGAVFAQVRTPWHRLELAWEKNGTVKTVALQVSGREAKELVRDLRKARPRETCYSR